jgi:hypothetical protein
VSTDERRIDIGSPFAPLGYCFSRESS